MLKSGYLLELLAFLSREGKRTGIPEQLNETELEIQRAANYLYSHYSEPLSLSEDGRYGPYESGLFFKKVS